MGSRHLCFLAVLLLLGCSPQTASTPAPTAVPTASPRAATAVPLRAPADDILSDREAGFRRTAGEDHVSLAQAAEQEQNQPLALTRLRSWGLVEEATRSWRGNAGAADEILLLMTRDEGAMLAYQFLMREALVPPLEASACAPLIRADECAEGRSGAASVIVARVGSYVFRLRVSGTDADRLAALQVGRISN